MTQPIIITGAYGRIYDKDVNVIIDWRADKDFRIVKGASGSYINKSDFEKYANRLDGVIFIQWTPNLTVHLMSSIL